MPVRSATAKWNGTITSGRGRMRAESGAFDVAYSFATRFEDDERGTNPEELIGSAHAGCFSMALAKILGDGGHPPESIETTAEVKIEKQGEGFAITTIRLRTSGKVPGISAAEFETAVRTAKENCPVSKVLAGAEIELVEARHEA